MAHAQTTTAETLAQWKPSDQATKHGYNLFASRILKEGIRLEKAGDPAQAKLRYLKCRAYCDARAIPYPPFTRSGITGLMKQVGSEPHAAPAPQPTSGEGHVTQGEPAEARGSSNTVEERRPSAIAHETASPEPVSPPAQPAGPVSQEVDFSWLGQDGPPPAGFRGSARALGITPPEPAAPVAPAPQPPAPEPAPAPKLPVPVQINEPVSEVATLLPVLIEPTMYAKPRVVRKALVTHFCANQKLVGVRLSDLNEEASMWRRRKGLKVGEVVEVVLSDGTPLVNAVYEEVKRAT